MNYALIGCGRIATNHIKAALNNKLNIVAVCDVLPEAMEALLAKHGLENDASIKRYTDYKQMIAENDITLASIATGLYLAKNGVNVLLADERSEIRFLVPGRELVLHQGSWKYLSVFPMEGTLTGVCIRGAYYPLEGASLTADYPLGVSNEFTSEAAQLSCTGGCGVVVLTCDDV